MEDLLRLQGIGKSYGGVKVLADVDFSLAKGEVHCIVGENGAGKSTLIKILSGAIQPDEGEIILKGKRCRNTNPNLQIEWAYPPSIKTPICRHPDGLGQHLPGSEIRRFGMIDRRNRSDLSEFIEA